MVMVLACKPLIPDRPTHMTNYDYINRTKCLTCSLAAELDMVINLHIHSMPSLEILCDACGGRLQD